MPSKITPEEQARRDVREVSEKCGPEIRAKIALAARPAPEAGSVVERPAAPLFPDNGQPAWKQIVHLCAKYNFPNPNVRLRDELAAMLVWARFGESSAAAIAERDAAREYGAQARIRENRAKDELVHYKDGVIRLTNTLKANASRAERLEKALREIALHPDKYNDGESSYSIGWAFHDVQRIARAVLKQEGE